MQLHWSFTPATAPKSGRLGSAWPCVVHPVPTEHCQHRMRFPFAIAAMSATRSTGMFPLREQKTSEARCRWRLFLPHLDAPLNIQRQPGAAARDSTDGTKPLERIIPLLAAELVVLRTRRRQPTAHQSGTVASELSREEASRPATEQSALSSTTHH